MKIKLAKYVAEFLVTNGISDCFMITGGGAMHLNDALGHEERLRCIFNHHEQASAIAAEGYTRLTNRLCAVCVTSGPGGTNAITGVVGAWLDSIPMLVLSGQVKRETTTRSYPELGLRQLGDQEFDIIGSVSNMTKYAVMVTDPLEIAYHLEKALYLATHGRGGPVWLDLPLDVIPFCEIFVIPYVFWYALIAISLGYFALYNVDSFKKLQIFIMITQGVAMAIYIAFPNMQDLRPVEFARDNLLTRLVGFLYTFDTDTNVCLPFTLHILSELLPCG